MYVLRSSAALAAATLSAVIACTDPAEPLPLNGDAVLESGVLRVRADDGPDDIAIVYSAGGVDVERDGESARFTDPVVAIEVSAGAGNDVVRYDQTVIADVELTILSGEGDDEVVASFAPAGAGSGMTLSADLRTGPGSDRMEFRWTGAAVPALNPYIELTGETRSQRPEVDDEVLVAFEHGDPDRPVVLGGLWNGSGPADSPPGGDTRRLSLELDFRAGHADAAIAISGGVGPDQVELDADYSDVTLQQGRISFDADLNEGDNTFGEYIVTSATHTYVDTKVAAGDGDNVVQLEDVIGGDGERTYAIDLGDGDNETTIRFGDGARGRRPATGTRNVTATYRSGSGANSVTLDSEVVEPLASDVTIDYGAGQGDTQGRYKLEFPWDRSSSNTPPGAQTAPSQVRVIVLSATDGDVDIQLEVGDHEVDGPEAIGVVTATGVQVQQTDLEFLHQRASGSGSDELEDEWQLRANGFATAGDASLVVDIPPGLERLVYLQNDVEVADGATMKVELQGDDVDDAMLAHLIGISGAGRYEFLADGGAGSELLAALTRDLDAGGGAEMVFTLLGGDGDDVLGLERPAGIAPGTPISHSLTGGTGTDSCFTSRDVPVTACERLEPIGDELPSLIEATFGTTLADVWRQ